MGSGELVVEHDAPQPALGGWSDGYFHLSSPEQKLLSLETVCSLTSDSVSLSFSFLPGKGIICHGHYRDYMGEHVRVSGECLEGSSS